MIFNNTAVAFSLKSDRALSRAYFLFKLISKASLVKLGTNIINTAIKWRLPINSLVRHTVFDHFCGGINEKDCMPTIERMYSKGLYGVLDYSVEGKNKEDEFNAVMDRIIKIIHFSKENPATPIAVFKPTALGRFELFEKISSNDMLNKKEQEEWHRIEQRFHKICNAAKTNDIIILIDAEESWMQRAADTLVTEMMKTYNTEKPIVYNTLQMYRHDRLSFLKQEHRQAKDGNYHLGYKVVRGAYMEKENERAEKQGYVSPICINKQETDKNYNNAVHYILEHLDDISIFAGTHNEDSCYLIMDLMKAKELKHNDSRIYFGQLYGMSDHISFNLANHGYNATKYIPFGPVKDVMPYLIRRAQENTSVAGQTSRELELLTQERKRRKEL